MMIINKTRVAIVGFKHMLTAMFLLVCSAVISACAGSPTAPAIAPTTYTVSGIVFQRTRNGTAPVEGIWVADARHAGSLTDKHGYYSISGLRAGEVFLSASGSYYYMATVIVTINGNAKQDIEIKEVYE